MVFTTILLLHSTLTSCNDIHHYSLLVLLMPFLPMLYNTRAHTCWCLSGNIVSNINNGLIPTHAFQVQQLQSLYILGHHNVKVCSCRQVEEQVAIMGVAHFYVRKKFVLYMSSCTQSKSSWLSLHAKHTLLGHKKQAYTQANGRNQKYTTKCKAHEIVLLWEELCY